MAKRIDSKEKDNGVCSHRYLPNGGASQEYGCIITGRTCVANVDANGKIDSHGYMNGAAKFCPAYNLQKGLAKSLQVDNIKNQKLELEAKIKWI